MTISPAQWEKIYAGIPATLDGVPVTVLRTRQFINRHAFPVVLITPITEGIPVTGAGQLWERYDPSEGVMEVARGQICKARISAVIEAVGLTEARALAYAFSADLFTYELSIDPIRDRMQFRGSEPPTLLAPYQLSNKSYVQRYNIDFFVEYEFVWITKAPVIREVEATIGEDAPARFYGSERSIISLAEVYTLDALVELVGTKSYSLDVIIDPPE